MSLFRVLSPSSVAVPAGRYFLGDPCYAVPDEHWSDLLASCEIFDKPVGAVAGTEVLAFGTFYGDGTYPDQCGRLYSVDAGLIGLTPAAFATKYDALYLSKLGQWVEFDEDVVAETEGGLLSFGPYVIQTADLEEEDDDRFDSADAEEDEGV
jgi:hypothetical protein